MAKLQVRDVIEQSVTWKCTVIEAAIKMDYHNMLDPILWPELKSESADDGQAEVTPLVGNRNDVLTRMAKALAHSVQFPVNTAFVHGLGVIASAMNRHFTYDNYGKPVPVNMYVLTCQPPGSGKSPVNDMLKAEVELQYALRNEANAKERRKLNIQIDSLKEAYKQEKNEKGKAQMLEDIERLAEKLDFYPYYEYTRTDVTPEALESYTRRNGGYFNLISDEQTALRGALGMNYGDGSPNNEMLLQAWDNGSVHVERVGRTGYSGRPSGCIACIAQEGLFEAILDAGAKSMNGISHRFFLYREPTLIGTRDSMEEFHPVPEDIKQDYATLIKNLMTVDKMRSHLTFSPSAMAHIQSVRARLEPKLAPGGDYAHPLLQGFAVKAGSHIAKMACVLHAVEEFAPGGRKRTIITDEAVSWAYSLFMPMLDSYADAVDRQGLTGKYAEAEAMKHKIRLWTERGKKSLSAKEIHDLVKGGIPFKGTPKLQSRLKDVIFPMLQDDGYIAVAGNKVYFNPKI